jgi:hypothetical protein
MSSGKTVHAVYIKKALTRFRVILSQKIQDWILYRDNAPVHTAASASSSNGSEGAKTIRHPPYFFAKYCQSGLFSVPFEQSQKMSSLMP